MKPIPLFVTASARAAFESGIHPSLPASYTAHNVDITNGEGTGARLRKSAPAPRLTDGGAGIIENN
ncbi:hypothetical protein [Mesorhizobium sp. M1322]|uniref:hypothetical protein n=1 Tax=Mesorhizobium sp. M1322 TaxID=2957081 RepID=UPI0033377339